MYLSVHILIFNTFTALTYNESGSSAQWFRGSGRRQRALNPARRPGPVTWAPTPWVPLRQVRFLAPRPFLMVRHRGEALQGRKKCGLLS